MSDPLIIEAAQQQAELPPLVQMSPWVVQGVIYELLTKFFMGNTPESLGYPFKLRYDPDKLKSGIFVDIAYNYDASAANKRPSIFVSRGDSTIKGLTFGHQVPQIDVANSEQTKLLIHTVPITVSVIASPIMMVELLADYAKQAFISFQHQIQTDFCFRRFRLIGISKPQIYVEAKEYFVVNLSIEVVYDEGWVLIRDDLKLKSIGLTIYESLVKYQQGLIT